MRVFFVRDQSNNPVACVASELIANDLGRGQEVCYALSVRNPLDDFRKPAGRRIAETRLQTVIEFGRNALHNPSLAGVVGAKKGLIKFQIMRQLAGNKSLPDRVRKAAKNWIRTAEGTKRESSGGHNS